MLQPALQTLFDNFIAGTGGLFVWRLYTITLFGGGVMRFADGDFDIKAVSTDNKVNGFTYPTSGVRVDQKASKTQAHWKIGLDVDTWTVVMMPRPFDPITGEQFPDKIGSVPWLQAAQAGSLDNADFQVDEAYYSTAPTWPMPPGGASPVGCKTVFAGKIAQVDTSNAAAVLTVNDFRDLLSMSMPRHFYQASCRHTLFDIACNADGNMNATSFAINGAAGAGSTQATIIAPGLPTPQGSGTYKLGRIQFTSGANATFWRTVRDWDGSFTLSLMNPLPFPVSPADTFVAYPGCDKSFASCQAFNNLSNLGAFPYIPPPEVAA